LSPKQESKANLIPNYSKKLNLILHYKSRSVTKISF